MAIDVNETQAANMLHSLMQTYISQGISPEEALNKAEVMVNSLYDKARKVVQTQKTK